MSTQEQTFITSLKSRSVLFKSSVKGDSDDKFEVPFGIMKTVDSLSGFIIIIENSRFFRMPEDDEEIEFTFPQVTSTWPPNTFVNIPENSKGKLLMISSYESSYETLYGWEPGHFLSVDELIKLTLKLAMKAYEQGRPKDLSLQMEFDF